jgi:hypothetical protein
MYWQVLLKYLIPITFNFTPASTAIGSNIFIELYKFSNGNVYIENTFYDLFEKPHPGVTLLVKVNWSIMEGL